MLIPCWYSIPAMCEEGYRLLLENQGEEPMPACSFLLQPQHAHYKMMKAQHIGTSRIPQRRK